MEVLSQPCCLLEFLIPVKAWKPRQLMYLVPHGLMDCREEMLRIQSCDRRLSGLQWGPKDRINIRILQPGSKAQDKGAYEKSCLSDLHLIHMYYIPHTL